MAWNKEIFEMSLKTQPYDKGLERFVGKYEPSLPILAVIAIEKGCHNDYGTAIFFQQDKRRCLILETLYGLSDEEVFWYTMMSWSKFQPRFATPRSEPGKLYYPAAASHIVEKYWNYLDNPVSHPDCNESEFTKAAMTHLAAALSEMDLSSFEPSVDAEAMEKPCRIATQAALSRRCPIQDAYDYWVPRRESAAVSVPEPGQDSHNVGT
jgi:hypothetical protein